MSKLIEFFKDKYAEYLKQQDSLKLINDREEILKNIETGKIMPLRGGKKEKGKWRRCLSLSTEGTHPQSNASIKHSATSSTRNPTCSSKLLIIHFS